MAKQQTASIHNFKMFDEFVHFGSLIDFHFQLKSINSINRIQFSNNLIGFHQIATWQCDFNV